MAKTTTISLDDFNTSTPLVDTPSTDLDVGSNNIGTISLDDFYDSSYLSGARQSGLGYEIGDIAIAGFNAAIGSFEEYQISLSREIV